jgi:hypothetical protein
MRLPRMQFTCCANQEEHFLQCIVTEGETIVNYVILHDVGTPIFPSKVI